MAVVSKGGGQEFENAKRRYFSKINNNVGSYSQCITLSKEMEKSVVSTLMRKMSRPSEIINIRLHATMSLSEVT